ncbi:MAG: type III ribulose-bisphosphate carboxylase [archaeon]
MKYEDFIDEHYKPKKTDLICKFRLKAKGFTFEKAAGGVSAESTIGTWTELTTEKEYMRKLAGIVFELKNPYFSVAYPIELFEEGNMPNMLSGIAGNLFGLKEIDKVRLEDIIFPKKLAKSFKGPKYGINGVRKITRVKNRPLVGTIVKPKLGLNFKDHAKVAYDAWFGGCDVVKDDENLSSQSFNRFEPRLKETLRLKRKAEKETGEFKAYMINVTASGNEMIRRARLVEDSGNEYMMVDILTVGWAALQDLRDLNVNLVMHAHRAGHAALTKDKEHGISMPVLAKCSRLIGVDQLHVGTAVGKMSEGKSDVLENIKACKEELYGIKKVMPVASGGLHPGHVEDLYKIFGKDFIAQAGGGIHGHPQGTVKGAMAMRQAMDAVVQGYTLKEYAKKHKELAIALEKWK